MGYREAQQQGSQGQPHEEKKALCVHRPLSTCPSGRCGEDLEDHRQAQLGTWSPLLSVPAPISTCLCHVITREA